MSDWEIVEGDENAAREIGEEALRAAGWSVANIADSLKSPSVSLLVAQRSRQAPCGLLLWRRVADDGEILTLAVDPRRRRQGAARALLCAIADLVRDGAIFLEVAQDNEPAIGLYKAAGFLQTGRRARYYRGEIDALVMRLDPRHGIFAAQDDCHRRP